MQLQHSKLKLGKITKIFITHMHGAAYFVSPYHSFSELILVAISSEETVDHCLGLVPLLANIMSGVNNTSESLEALKAQGTAKIVSFFRPSSYTFIR